MSSSFSSSATIDSLSLTPFTPPSTFAAISPHLAQLTNLLTLARAPEDADPDDPPVIVEMPPPSPRSRGGPSTPTSPSLSLSPPQEQPQPTGDAAAPSPRPRDGPSNPTSPSLSPAPQELPQTTGDAAVPSPGPSRKKPLPSLSRQRTALQKKKAAEKTAAKKQAQKDRRSQAAMGPKELNHLRQREVTENAPPNVAQMIAQSKIVYAPGDIHHFNPRRLFEGDTECKDPASDGKMLFRISERLANQRLESDHQARPPGLP